VENKTIQCQERRQYCVHVFVIQQQTAIQRQSRRMETFHPSLANRGEETDPRPAPSATPHNAGISCTTKPQNARLTIQLLPLVRSPFLTARACMHVPRFYRLWRLLDRDSAWLVYAHFIIIFWVVRVFSPVFFHHCSALAAYFLPVRRVCDR
jgi:hypothetical protein